MKKKIAILGSTGSIGKQALEIINSFPHLFEAEILTTYQNHELIIQQARQYQPNIVVVVENAAYHIVKDALKDTPIKVFGGEKSIEDVVTLPSLDMVLTALVGFSGLLPTLKAIEHGKTIALANKETLVAGGEIVINKAKKNRTPIIPVDSEHSAIFQCLQGEQHNPVEKIILTASGGPFRGKKRETLKNITPQQALKHPNWSMGNKITIDSATLMNKGLEVIEAHWLFHLPPEKIEVIIHPESIIHSMVAFEDGCMMAQLGLPDMKLPIQYAFSYPHRLKNNFKRLSLETIKQLTFEKPDPDTFRNLSLAYHALREGGNMPCILNAANEITVDAFLKGLIGFLDIAEINEKVLQSTPFIPHPTIEELTESDRRARHQASQLCSSVR